MGMQDDALATLTGGEAGSPYVNGLAHGFPTAL